MWKKMVFENLGLKAIALLLAIVIWFLLAANYPVEKEPIHLRVIVQLPEHLKEEYIIVEQIPSDLTVLCSGKREEVTAAISFLREYEQNNLLNPLFGITDNSFRDVENLNIVFDLPNTSLNFPGNAKLEVDQVEQIHIRLARMRDFHLPVKTPDQWIGELPAGVSDARVVNIQPSLITFRGPEGVIFDTDTLLTEAVQIGSDGFLPDTPARFLQVLSLERNSIPVTILEKILVEVQFFEDELTWTTDEIQLKDIQFHYRAGTAFIAEVDVTQWKQADVKNFTLAGPPEQIRSMQSLDKLIYYIDFADLNEENFGVYYPIKLDLPYPEIRVTGEPPVLPVKLKKVADE